MARDDPQMNFRIPAALKDELAKAAATNRRTLTAEMVSRLQASFEANSLEIPSFLKIAESAATVTARGAVVLHLTIKPGMTVDEVLELLEAASMALPEGTRVVVR